MRHRTIVTAGLALVALAVIAAYVAWAAYAGGKVGLGWAGLRSAWPYLLAGVLTVACVIAAFVRLAFFSDRSGFDDSADVNRR